MPVDLRLRRLRALPLVAVLGVGLALGSPPAKAANCSGTSVGITPLNDLGSGSYRGSQGGLYPGGANTRPPDHEAAGLVLASAIEPLDPTGRPDPNGRYALISIGMSNTTMEFQTFQATADQQPEKDPHLVLVDGGQGGVTATKWAAPDNRAWQVLDERLAAKAVTREQVAVAWVKLANANPRSGWPTHAEELEADMQRVVQNLRDRFPNIRIAYLSSRIYAGYSTSSLNPEPYAYESGFSVKLLLQKQIGGDPELNADPRRGRVRAPWLS